MPNNEMRAKKYLMVLASGLLLVGANVHASPANCDDDMTDDQRYQLEICASHAGCRIVAGVLTSCTSLKSFLGKLRLGRDRSGITDDTLNDALADSGVPIANLTSCTTKFDRNLCRQYLGLEDEKKEDQTPLLVQRMKDLVERAVHFNQKTFYTQVQPSLDACAASRTDKSNRDQICKHAQAVVNICRKEADYWRKSTNTAIAEAREAAGSQELTDIRRQLQSQQEQGAPKCPSTVPGTSREPTQVVEQWDREDREHAERMIGPCEGLRRSASDAVDSGDKGRASAEVDRFETTCSSVNATYEGLARMYKQRVSEIDDGIGGIVLPRRGGTAGTSSFQAALGQSGDGKRELSEQERAEIAQQPGMLTPLLSAMQEHAGPIDAQQYPGQMDISAGNQGGADGSQSDFCTPGAGFDARRCECSRRWVPTCKLPDCPKGCSVGGSRKNASTKLVYTCHCSGKALWSMSVD